MTTYRKPVIDLRTAHYQLKSQRSGSSGDAPSLEPVVG